MRLTVAEGVGQDLEPVKASAIGQPIRLLRVRSGNKNGPQDEAEPKLDVISAQKGLGRGPDGAGGNAQSATDD